MELKDVGQRITKLRKEKGWSQMTLAEKLNVSDKTVSKWENGGMPGIDLFPKMAKLFNVSIDYLMTGVEEDTSTEDNSVNKEEAQENTAASENAGKEEESVKAPVIYVCPKCHKENRNPGTHCTYCYHEFGDIQLELQKEEVEETVEITYDPETNKPICPKCNKINPYLDTHCIFCYHEFGKKSRPSSSPTFKKTGFYNSNGSSKNYWEKNEYRNSTVKPSNASQAGCLAYLLAFFFPLIGLIWGAVKGEKGVVGFSIAMMVLKFFTCVCLILGGVIAGAGI